MMNWLSILGRDRLVLFVLAGLAIFGVDAIMQQKAEREIVISLPLVEKLATQWEAQTKRPPSPSDLNMLIEGHIREEILMREAVALGLDIDDVIIRRRLAQKMEFLIGEGITAQQPTEAVLRNFYEENPRDFVEASRVSFRHIFLGASQEDADRLLTALKQEGADWRLLGQPFMLQREYIERTKGDIGETFGVAFMNYLFGSNALQAWGQPVRSAYGWHLVFIEDRRDEKQLSFEDAADRVARAWILQQEHIAREQAWRDLRTKYSISLAPVSSTADEAGLDE